MERPQAAVDAYYLEMTVDRIYEGFDRVNWRKNEAGETTCDNVSKGWFIGFRGSHESLGIGPEKPSWKVGDRIAITMRKLNSNPQGPNDLPR